MAKRPLTKEEVSQLMYWGQHDAKTFGRRRHETLPNDSRNEINLEDIHAAYDAGFLQGEHQEKWNGLWERVSELSDFDDFFATISDYIDNLPEKVS